MDIIDVSVMVTVLVLILLLGAMVIVGDFKHICINKGVNVSRADWQAECNITTTYNYTKLGGI